MRLLDVSRTHLVDRIGSDNAFVTDLANAECITWPQRDYILNIPQPLDRNDKLIDILTRRSMADFNNFVNVLSRHQPHLANLLSVQCKTYILYVLSQNHLLIDRYDISSRKVILPCPLR